MKSFPPYFIWARHYVLAPLENHVGVYPSIFARKCRTKLANNEFGKKDCEAELVSEFTYYIRIGMVSVKTSPGTPYNLLIKLFFFFEFK